MELLPFSKRKRRTWYGGTTTFLSIRCAFCKQAISPGPEVFTECDESRTNDQYIWERAWHKDCRDKYLEQGEQ